MNFQKVAANEKLDKVPLETLNPSLSADLQKHSKATDSELTLAQLVTGSGRGRSCDLSLHQVGGRLRKMLRINWDWEQWEQWEQSCKKPCCQLEEVVWNDAGSVKDGRVGRKWRRVQVQSGPGRFRQQGFSSAGPWSPAGHLQHVGITCVFSRLELFLRLSVNIPACGDWVGQGRPALPVGLQVTPTFSAALFCLVFNCPNSTGSSKPSFNSHQHFLPCLPPQLTRSTISLVHRLDRIPSSAQFDE